jgi:AraC family transcriptional regulator of adaptative response/methylated-DNA-[protein]-cysteine methyltransferase
MNELVSSAARVLAGPAREVARSLRMLTSRESSLSTPLSPVSEAAHPLHRKKRRAEEDAASARWRAVAARDRAADGRFVFAVTTTGVYCRPSCPARRPRRENVKFYADGEGARAAGFRSCKRCRPDELPATDAAVAKARQLLDSARGESMPLPDLATAVGLSPSHLSREFERRVGLSPKQYALALRAERLKREIAGNRTVLDAGFEAGYGSASRVYDQAARQLGMSPGRFRDGGRGVRIAFSTRRTGLGRLLLAVTERGLCAVRLGEDDASVRAALAAEFPNAIRVEDRPALAPVFDQVLALLAGSTEEPALDVEATAFQARVWQALRRIPRGGTVTYGELARAIGRPTSARAVARACATNPVAIVLPCHRVVGAGGALTGYRWGVERKRALQEQEAKTAGSPERPAPR